MPSYKCSNCDDTFTSKKKLNQHNKECVQNTKQEFVPKDFDGSVVWRLQDDPNIHQDEKSPIIQEAINKMMSIITSCHQKLYNTGAIVGAKARNDIMKILNLFLLEIMFIDKKSVIWDRINKLIEEKHFPNKKKLDRYIEICQDVSKLLKTDNDVLDEWRELTSNFLAKVLPETYSTKDIIYCQNDEIFCELINSLSKGHEIYTNPLLHETVSGVIHEFFVNAYAKKKGEGKEFGQFFTPRKLVNLIVHEQNIFNYISSKEKINIYDPCMGSCGFLSRILSNFKNKNIEIFGNELDKDTYQIGFTNIMSLIHKIPNNLINCDTLKTYYNEHVDLILTNPPFGTSMKYSKAKKNDTDGLLEYFTKNKKEYYPDFKDIYPIKSNDGPCLFLQHCIYKLKENGICGVVLPDGKLLTSDNFKGFRKWLCSKVQILKLIFVPSGVFEHTGTKTCVMIFTKNGKSTETIELLKTNINCEEIVKICNISINDLSCKDYKFDENCYLRDVQQELLITNSTVEWKKLGELSILKNGERIVKSKTESGEYNVYGGGDATFTTNTFNRDGITCKIGRYGISIHNCVQIINGPYFLHDNGMTIESNNEQYLLNKYMWYYLLINKEIVFNCNKGSIENLDIDMFKDIKIPVPSLEIQNKVILELDKITEQIKTIEQLKEQIKEEMKMYFNYGFSKEININNSNEWEKLGEISILKNGNRIVQSKTQSGEYNVYGGGDETFTTNTFNRDGITCKISRFGMSLHNCVQIINEPYYLNDSGMTIESTNEQHTSHKYIWYYLLINKEIVYNCGKGSGQKNIDIAMFKDIKIPVPSLDIQKEYIQLFDKLYEEIEQLNKKHTQLKEYSKYILELSFT